MDEGIGGDIDGTGEGEFAKAEGEGRSVGKEIVEEAEASSSSGKGENEGELTQDDQNEIENESNSEQFNPNEPESDEEQAEFNPNDSGESEPQSEFNPNVPDSESSPDQFNPNEDGEENEPDFNSNELENGEMHNYKVPDIGKQDDEHPKYKPKNEVKAEEEEVANPKKNLQTEDIDNSSEGDSTSSGQNTELEPGQEIPSRESAEPGSERVEPNVPDSDSSSVQANPDVSSEQFNPNESESIKSREEQTEFDPNEQDEKLEPQFDPNSEGDKAEEKTNERNEGEAEEAHENINSQLTSTVLLNENEKETQEGIQENDQEQKELEKEVEKELKEGVEAVNKYLEEEAEFINAHQEILSAYEAEQLYESMKEEEANNNEEITKNSEEIESEKEEAGQAEEALEPQAKEDKSDQDNFEEEGEVSFEEVEQHQVEPLIEEALETEPEPIVNEEEIEKLQEMSIEEQFQTVRLNEIVEELVENQEIEQEELNKNEEIEETEKIADPKEESLELEKELELNLVEQHQLEPFIEESMETEPEAVVNEEEIETLQQMELEEQFETVRSNEYLEELLEWQEEEQDQEQEKAQEIEIEQTEQEEEIQKSTYLQEKLEEKEVNLEFDYEEREEVHQHQVEAAIEEELEKEQQPEPIVEEEKLEHIKNLEPEKQLEAELFYELIEELKEIEQNGIEETEEKKEQKELAKEEKIAQITQELEITQISELEESEAEISSQELEEKLENISVSSDIEEEKEVPSELIEAKDHQQELEEILEQYREIEQEALNEVEREREEQEERKEQETDIIERKYERAKELYREQTGKRPIYAKKETIGFKQWLEQQKESTEKQKEKEKEKKEAKEEQELEQEKDESWKWDLRNWIGNSSEISTELRSILFKLVEEYEELRKLIEKYSQLYNKAQNEKLSKNEINQLKSLIKALQKIEPIHIELFLGIREIKRYLITEQYYSDAYWDRPYVNRVKHHFFTRLAQRYKSSKEAQKKENVEKILKNWIENATEEKISPIMKAGFKEIVENYNKINTVAVNFMELYRKSQKKRISKEEKNQLKALIKILQKIDPEVIETFAKIRAVKRYLNDREVSSNKKHSNQILYNYFATSKRKSALPSYKYSFTPLTSKQIKIREEKYQKILEELCVKYALDFKELILKEYGKIMEMKIPLSSHFGFRLDGAIRKVTNTKRDRAIGIDILERVKNHIVTEYNKWDKDPLKEISFRKVMGLIKEYQEFSKYVSGKSGQGNFSISNIKYEKESEELVPKSWLIENLRYLLPKKYDLPIQDNLLSWFIYGDTPSYGRVSKIRWTTEGKELIKRIYISELLSIEYNVNKLNEKAFSDKGIEIANRDLKTLKKKVSFLIHYYIFGGYHESTYVSQTTNKKLEVGKSFYTDEFEIIRAIFFTAAEVNNGKSLNFEELQIAAGTSDLKSHLAGGFGFGDSLDQLRKYLNELSKNRPPNSNSQIFRDAKELIDGYHDKYLAKYRAFQKTRKSKTRFQGIVHKEVDRVLGLSTTPEAQVRAVVKQKEIETINLNGVKENVYVHGTFKFDAYHELTSALKKYLTIDDKWMGIAFEAMGTYWHSLPSQKEADRKKRLICKEKNIILIEIWEDCTSNTWGSEIVDQIKQKTGVEIPRNKLGVLAKYLEV